MGLLKIDSLIDVAIGLVFLAIIIPIVLDKFNDARNATGADENLIAGLDISNLLLGLVPVGVLLLVFRMARGGAAGGGRRGR